MCRARGGERPQFGAPAGGEHDGPGRRFGRREIKAFGRRELLLRPRVQFVQEMLKSVENM